LMESLFVGCYGWLLYDAERESLKQQNAREIIERTTTLLRSLFNAGDSVSNYAISHDHNFMQRYNAVKIDIAKQITWLRNHLQGDNTQLKLLDKIEKDIAVTLAVLDEMKTVGETESQVVALKFALKLRVKAQATMEVLLQNLIEFLNTEKKIESTSPQILKSQREKIKVLLMAGFALNTVAAVGLTILFVRTVTSRLSIIEENSLRLRERQTLRAPLMGGDEIALIDQAFHEMTHFLRGEEARMRASEEQIQSIIDQMPIGLLIISDLDIIEYSNPAIEKLLLAKSGALAGRKVADHFVNDDVKATTIGDTSSFNGLKNLLACRADKSKIPIEFSVTDVSLGRIPKRLAMIVDVAEKRAMEKMKEAFVAMVSHDLRTPLTSVGGFLEMLPMGVYGPISPAVVVESKAADAQVAKLITLINDLLNLEKLRAGQLAMRVVAIDLEDTVDAAVDSVYNLAEQLQSSVIFEGCSFTVMADQELLQQALVKTLESMLKLCPRHSTIEVKVAQEQDQQIALTFKTINPGLSELSLNNIFEPFEIIEAGERKISLGLYLALMREIISNLAGSCGANIETETGRLLLWIKIPPVFAG